MYAGFASQTSLARASWYPNCKAYNSRLSWPVKDVITQTKNEFPLWNRTDPPALPKTTCVEKSAETGVPKALIAQSRLNGNKRGSKPHGSGTTAGQDYCCKRLITTSIRNLPDCFLELDNDDPTVEIPLFNSENATQGSYLGGQDSCIMSWITNSYQPQ